MHRLLYVLLLMSCCAMPLSGLYDDRIAPKWYMAIVTGMLIVCLEAWRSLRNGDADTDRMKHLSASAFFVLIYNVGCVLIYDIVQSPHGLSQPVRGTFDNPTGYALTTCLLIVMSAWNIGKMSRWKKVCVISILVLACAAVIFTESRTGILCLAIYLLVLIYHVRKIGLWMRYAVMGTMVVGVMFYVGSVKSDSTTGRSFILQRTLELIADKPVYGYGKNGFMREYMPWQAEFFRNHTDSGAAWFADNIIHPLNEFLYIWTDYGLTGLTCLILLFMIPVVVYIRKRDANAEHYMIMLLTIFLFATTSYPHLYPITTVVIMIIYADLLHRLFRYRYMRMAMVTVAVIIMGIVTREFIYERQWGKANRAVQQGYARNVVDWYVQLSSHYTSNHRFLYSQMFAQYQARHFTDATVTYHRLRKLCSSYDMELLMGDILSHLHRYPEAIEHYEEAMYMCPVRFAPLEGQMNAYIQMGDSVRADSVARVILGKTVKVESGAVERIRNEARIIVE